MRRRKIVMTCPPDTYVYLQYTDKYIGTYMHVEMSRKNSDAHSDGEL